MLESDADRAAYLEAFGDDCTCDAGPFRAIFDNGYVLSGELGETAPALVMTTADVERLGLREGITVTVRAKAYRVRRSEPDGTGMSVVILDG